jgi:hypothetical protein
MCVEYIATVYVALPRLWQTKTQNLSIFVSSVYTLMYFIYNNALVATELHEIYDPHLNKTLIQEKNNFPLL